MGGNDRFDFVETPLAGAYEIHRKKLGDDRGFLERIFCGRELAQRVGFQTIAQINHTCTREVGVVRGMHYQEHPSAEAKLVTCLRGAVQDVIVDIRKGSDTFLQSFSIVLAEDQDITLFVPRGFAHGFQTLKPDTELLYLHDNFYNQDHERGLNALDPIFAIDWPNPIALMSERDKEFPLLTPNFIGIEP